MSSCCSTATDAAAGVSLCCTAEAQELVFPVLMQMADSIVSSVSLPQRAGLDQRAILRSFNPHKSVRSHLLASLSPWVLGVEQHFHHKKELLFAIKAS